MLYRICTEDKNIDQLHALVSKSFDGFTSYVATGYWKGVSEQARIIEIVAQGNKRQCGAFESIRALCYAIKELNSQECVLLQAIENQDYFI